MSDFELAPEAPESSVDSEVTLVEPDSVLPSVVELVVPAEASEVVTTEHEECGLASASGPGLDVAAIAELANSLGRLESGLFQRLDGLQAQFDREIRAEVTREKVVDRLHAELQEYKQDLLLGTLKPVLLDLIQLHDDMGKIVAAADAEATATRLLAQVEGFQQGVEDILYRQGVEAFTVEENGFDARRQRAVSTVLTDDPALARRVCARLRKGFAAGEKVIRPEVVSVYALKRE